MVNSRWTQGHIDQLWHARYNRARVVYPPCDTLTLQQLPLARAPLPAAATAAAAAAPVLVSVAQFRPEKNHALQLRAFALARQAATKGELGGVAVTAATARRVASVRLVFVGGVRNDADRARLERLGELAQELVRGVAALGPREPPPPTQRRPHGRPFRPYGADNRPAALVPLALLRTEGRLGGCVRAQGVSDSVEFRVGVEHGELVQVLGSAVAGLHSMRDEHFGISVVEYMAAGAPRHRVETQNKRPERPSPRPRSSGP